MLFNVEEKLLPDSICNKVSQFVGSKKWSLSTMTPDASHRIYFRIVTNMDSWVLMWIPQDRKQLERFVFFQDLFFKSGILVPQVFLIEEDLQFAILEDLGDCSFQGWIGEVFDSNLWPSDKQMIATPAVASEKKWLESLDKIFEIIERIQSIDTRFVSLSFDLAKLGYEWGWTYEYLIKPALGELSEKVILAINSRWLQEAWCISELLSSQAKYFCHRDFHSRNILVKDGAFYLIDFQDARKGTIYYDWVSFFFDSYILPNDSSKKQSYSKIMEIFDSWDEKLFYHQAFQRALKACGSFSSFYFVKNDYRYLGYIVPTLLRLRDEVLSNVSSKDFWEELVDYLLVFWGRKVDNLRSKGKL